MREKIFSLSILCILFSVLFSGNAYASNDETSEQLGFVISEQSYDDFGYIIEEEFSNYYSGKNVGVTTFSFVYCRGTKKALGKNCDLCCIKLLTEPNTIKLTEKYLIFFTKTKTYKFGIDELSVVSDKSQYSGFAVNKLDYVTSADAAKSTSSSSGSIGFSLGGVSIDRSVVETISKSIVDVTDASTRKKVDITFEFGNPSTNEQKERVYEQTEYFIMQEYLSNLNKYTNNTSVTAKYSCDSKSSSKTLPITTKIEY